MISCTKKKSIYILKQTDFNLYQVLIIKLLLLLNELIFFTFYYFFVLFNLVYSIYYTIIEHTKIVI